MSDSPKIRSYLPYAPLVAAVLLFCLTEYSRITGTGPGLAFLVAALCFFPTAALLSIFLAGQGNRLAAGAGVIFAVIAAVLLQFDGQPNSERMIGYWYISFLAATTIGTLCGRIANHRHLQNRQR